MAERRALNPEVEGSTPSLSTIRNEGSYLYDMADKIYVGGAREMNGTNGIFHKVSFSAKDLATMLENVNEKGYVNLVMNQRKQVGQYGQTHSLSIDTWVPNKEGQHPAGIVKRKYPVEEIKVEDIPF